MCEGRVARCFDGAGPSCRLGTAGMSRLPGFRVLTAIALVGALSLAGCNSADRAGTRRLEARSAPAGTAATSSYESLRSGVVQLQGSIESIAEARELAGRLKDAVPGDYRLAVEDIVGYLDSAGTAISQALGDPPSESAYNADRASYEKQRASIATAVGDAQQDMSEAAGIVSSLDQAPADVREKLLELEELIDVARQDVGDSLGTLKGGG